MTLTCTVAGDDSIDIFYWYVDGTVVSGSGSTYSIDSYDDTKDGDYQCSADNSDDSNTITLKHKTRMYLFGVFKEFFSVIAAGL